jgi:hypothetical protein
MDWIDLALDSDQWRALVNMVMNFQVPLNAGLPLVHGIQLMGHGGGASPSEMNKEFINSLSGG